MRRFAAVLLSAAAAVALMAQTGPLPKRKPGLWEMSISTDATNRQPAVTKMCIDEATNTELYNLGMGMSKKACSKADVRSDGKTITADSICAFGSTQTTSHARTVFAGDTAFHSDISTHYDPPIGGKSEVTTKQDGKWTGPCPADMQPGDMIMPGGIKMNVKTMMQQQ